MLLSYLSCIKLMDFYGISSKNETNCFMFTRAKVPSMTHNSNILQEQNLVHCNYSCWEMYE
jgi:hypothetical protein